MFMNETIENVNEINHRHGFSTFVSAFFLLCTPHTDTHSTQRRRCSGPNSVTAGPDTAHGVFLAQNQTAYQ